MLPCDYTSGWTVRLAVSRPPNAKLNIITAGPELVPRAENRFSSEAARPHRGLQPYRAGTRLVATNLQ